MTTIIGLCGSLRHGSFNRMLLRAAVEMVPHGRSSKPVFAGVQQRQYDRRVPAALTPQLNLQLHELMESGLREGVVTTIEAKESR
jgi:hypothetical protein